MIRSLIVMIVALTAVACSHTENTPDEAPDNTPGVSVQALDGPFEFPESAVWDQARGAWFVSNFGQAFDPTGGTPDAPGYISRLDADGKIVEARLVESDGDFLGLAMLDGMLYASRGGELWEIDPDSGQHTVIAVPGAGFLNDVAAGNGALYITDTGANAVHRVVPGQEPEIFSQDPALQAPNGIVVDGNAVIVATLGAFPPNPDSPGGVFVLDDAGDAQQLGTQTGLFDGIEKLGDEYIVTDITGPLWQIGADGQALELGNLTELGLGSANDVGLDAATSTLLVSDLGSSQVWKITLR